MTGKICKLNIYKYELDEIIIESYSAKQWDDFLIVEVANATDEVLDNLAETLRNFEFETPKEIILIPKELELDFYGVEVEDD